jgi:hypothetical protein
MKYIVLYPTAHITCMSDPLLSHQGMCSVSIMFCLGNSQFVEVCDFSIPIDGVVGLVGVCCTGSATSGESHMLNLVSGISGVVAGHVHRQCPKKNQSIWSWTVSCV